MRRPTRAVIISLFVFVCLTGAYGQERTEVARSKPYVITYQPKAVYTDRARYKGVAGAVRLTITLLASGEIGAVRLVKTKGWKRMQKYGLTENAIRAAKQIKFTPKIVDGTPVSVVVTREYTFEVY